MKLLDHNGILLSNDTEFKPLAEPNNILITNNIWKYLNHIKGIVDKKNLIFCSIDEIAYELFGCEIYSSDEVDGAVCFYELNIIFFHPNFYYLENYEHYAHTFCHEIAHLIQSHLELFEKNNMLLLSENVKTEQQADTIAYHLMEIIFPEININNKYLSDYFSKESIEWLAEYYNYDPNIHNDLIIT